MTDRAAVGSGFASGELTGGADACDVAVGSADVGGTATGSRMTDSELAALLPPIPYDAHKYTRGSLLVLAGSARFPGAAVLAAQAAARAGAGYVTLAVPEPAVATARAHLLSIPVLSAPATDGAFAADAWGTLRDRLSRVDAVVLGPGLTTVPSVAAFVETVLRETVTGAARCPVLLDADALNLLASSLAERNGGTHTTETPAAVPPVPPAPEPTTVSVPPTSPAPLAPEPTTTANAPAATAPAPPGAAAATAPTPPPTPAATELILTPHAGELRRLLNATGADDARQLAGTLNAIVVAKGPETRIVSPTRCHRCTAGTPALAKAGTGDVLSGVIGSLLAQGVAPFDAAVLGVELHARAGRFAEGRLGRRAVCAEDVIEALPPTLKALEER